MQRVLDWLADVPAKIKVLVGAWPTWAVAVAGLVQYVLDEVVPHLPESWAVRASTVAAGVLVVIGVVSAAVARLTPVLFPQNRGLLAPPPAQSPAPMLRSRQPSGDVRVHDPAKDDPVLPPVDPRDYPPGAERLPHRRR